MLSRAVVLAAGEGAGEIWNLGPPGEAPGTQRRTEPCVDRGGCSYSSYGIIYTFPKPWLPGLGTAEEVQALSEAGASCTSSCRACWIPWGPGLSNRNS